MASEPKPNDLTNTPTEPVAVAGYRPSPASAPGWTVKRQCIFLTTLAATGFILMRAARRVSRRARPIDYASASTRTSYGTTPFTTRNRRNIRLVRASYTAAAR